MSAALAIRLLWPNRSACCWIHRCGWKVALGDFCPPVEEALVENDSAPLPTEGAEEDDEDEEAEDEDDKDEWAEDDEVNEDER